MKKIPRIRICPECGVPRRITSVFDTIEKILGISIEHIIVESERKLSYDYVTHFVPGIVIKLVRLTHVDVSSRKTVLQGQLMGFGDTSTVRWLGT